MIGVCALPSDADATVLTTTLDPRALSGASPLSERTVSSNFLILSKGDTSG